MKLLKWVGSKEFVADQILSLLPSKCRAFHERMCGSAVVGMKMRAAGRAQGLYLSDTNEELINVFRQVQKHPLMVQAYLRVLALEYNRVQEPKDVYAAWVHERNLIREFVTSRDAARTIAINRTCFNGLYRTNQKGGFNAPWGKRPKLELRALGDTIAEASLRLQGAIISVEPVLDSLKFAPDDVVFLDPPYDGTFASYGPTKWGDEELQQIAAYARKVSRLCPVFVCNSDTTKVRAAFEGSTFHEISGRSIVSQKTRSRGPRKELLIEVKP
jgi:DNA adenine methylase